jgi:hypothetical protein
VLLAASYGHLGRFEEARHEWQEVFRVNPDYSLEHRRKVLPYKNPDDFEFGGRASQCRPGVTTDQGNARFSTVCSHSLERGAMTGVGAKLPVAMKV